MKKLFFFMFGILCMYMLFAPLQSQASGIPWNNLKNITVDCRYTTGISDTKTFSISDISVDYWMVIGQRDGNTYYLYFISDSPFSMNYHVNTSTFSVSGVSNLYGLYYCKTGQYGGFLENANCPIFSGDSESLLKALANGDYGQFENWVDPEEPEPEYNPLLGYLTGMDKNISIISYLEGQNGSYVDVYNSQEIRFSWGPNTSSGVSLIRNDYQDLKIRITPKAKVSFSDIRGMSMGSFETTFDPVEVSPSKLSYQWESSALLDYVDSVQPSSSSRADIVLFFELQPVAYEFGSVSVGDVSLISLTYPYGFWGSKAKMLLTGQGVTSPFGAGISKDITIEVYDNRTEYNPDRPEIEKPGFSFDLDDFDLSDFTSTISSLLDYVLVIPQVVASILSFLPVWVTSLISLSFSLLPVLLVYKLIRG